MASNQTEHYGLNQWSLEDQVIMSEFNADNAKIEQALLELKSALPKYQTGSYTGTGTYGADNPSSLTFDFEPQLVLLAPIKKVSATPNAAICIRNATSIAVFCTGTSNNTPTPAQVKLSWDGNTLSWYSDNSGQQYNSKNTAYHYFAIG